MRPAILLCALASVLLAVPPDLPALRNEAAEPPLADFVGTERAGTRFLEIPDWDDRPCPRFVTRDQALEDVALLEYLFATAYSGKDYWTRHGVDFDSAWAGLRRRVLAQDESRVSVADLESTLCEALRGIDDGHLRVSGFRRTTLQHRSRAYFAEVILERRGEDVVVAQSRVAGLRAGDRYRDAPAHLYRTLSAPDREVYLVGVLSRDAPDTLAVRFASGRHALPLHRCRIGEVRNRADDPVFDRSAIGGVPVATIRRFHAPNAIAQLDAFVEYGRQARTESLLVVNLVNNGGGDAEYATRFVRNLNSVALEAGAEQHLHSPPVCQAFLPGKNGWALRTMPAEWHTAEGTLTDAAPQELRDHFARMAGEAAAMRARPERYWESVPRDTSGRGTFGGRVVIVANNFTASAGEKLIAKLLSSVPDAVLVGENSCGAYVFTSKNSYCLRHSRLKLELTKWVDWHPRCSGDRGFLPDLWLDSSTPVEEVARWLERPGDYRFRY